MIMVLIGPSGSGKTTFAKNYIKNNPGWVRVARDDIRKQLTGSSEIGAYFQTNNQELEKHVTQLQMEQIRYWVKEGLNVIVDNPHLKVQYLHVYKDHFGYLTDIMFVPIRNADPETCKARILQRDGDVNVSYIDRHFVNFRQLLKEAGSLLDRTIIKRNHQRDLFEALTQQADQKCVIVDVDGILKVWNELDVQPDFSPVHFILRSIKRESEKVTVIYLSGREEIWRNEVLQWIKQHDLPWDQQLFMRKAGDERSDVAVKQQYVLQEIADRYKPLFVIETSLLVTRALWQKLGIFCLNVHQELHSAA